MEIDLFPPVDGMTMIGHEEGRTSSSPGRIELALRVLGVDLNGKLIIFTPETIAFLDLGGTLLGLQRPFGPLARLLMRLLGFKYLDLRDAL